MLKELLRAIKGATSAAQLGLFAAAVALLNRQGINDFFAYALFALFLAIPVLHYLNVIYSTIKFRRLRGLGTYEKLTFDWRISADGSFEGDYLVVYKNCSDRNQYSVPIIDFFWSDRPSKAEVWGPTLTEESMKKWTLRKVEKTKPIKKFIDDKKRSFGFSFALSVVPEIRPSESVSYQIRIKTPESELKAISVTGDVAGFPALLMVESASLRYHCPTDHRFVLLSPAVQVVDLMGNPTIGADAFLPPVPILSTNGSSLSWDLKQLHPGYRYWFRYKIEKKV